MWKIWDETRGHHFGVSLGGLDGVRLPCTHDGIHTTAASDDFGILCAVPCASVISVLVREAEIGFSAWKNLLALLSSFFNEFMSLYCPMCVLSYIYITCSHNSTAVAHDYVSYVILLVQLMRKPLDCLEVQFEENCIT